MGSREYVQLGAQFHEGTTERSQIAQTSWKTFRLAQRLTAARTAELQAFWDSQQGGVVLFIFYNLIRGAYDSSLPRQPVRDDRARQDGRAANRIGRGGATIQFNVAA